MLPPDEVSLSMYSGFPEYRIPPPLEALALICECTHILAPLILWLLSGVPHRIEEPLDASAIMDLALPSSSILEPLEASQELLGH